MEEARRQIVLPRWEVNHEEHVSLGFPILLALLLHFALFQLSNFTSIYLPEQTKDNDAPIVIDALDETQRRPVVTSSKAAEQFDDKTPAPFHSEFRNRVKKQTRAATIGPFQEGTIKKGAGSGVEVDSDGYGIPQQAGEPGEKLGMHDLMSLPRTPHALSKDITEGGQTVLNTDKVLYASFINRIAEEIYEPWVQYAQDAVREVLSRGRKIEPTTYITKLNVIMNQSGEVVAMTVMESSSLNDLDDAPKKAFWKISRFPNPPSQLVDKDGLIRLNYEFHFEWKSSFYNIVPYQI